MKKTSLFVFLFVSVVSLYAQDALEGIIVEKYYVSTKKDNAKKNLSGELAVGSTTYRIYVDMAPGCRFMAAYGSPGHPLEISSTENIYNHLDIGAEHPLRIPERSYKKNIVPLDSWITIGPAGESYLGVLKDADTLQDFGNVAPFEKGFLLSDKKEMGYSLQVRDGFLRSEQIPQITLYNIDTSLNVLRMETKGKSFRVENGAWACMGRGVSGADSLGSNAILIAQITTKGELRYELNLMLRNADGSVTKYVAKDPIESEVLHKSLISNK
ncbi:MAG: hypothetical protein WCH03_05455 [Flavobacteriia bacterium]